MASRNARTHRAEPVPNRCRCSHFPTTHMRVVPTSGGGGFQLEPSGPCFVCLDSVCPRYRPSV